MGHRHRAAVADLLPEQGTTLPAESSTLPNLTVTKRVFCSTASRWHTISAMRLVAPSTFAGIHRLVGGDQHGRIRRRLRGSPAPPWPWRARCCEPPRALLRLEQRNPLVGRGMEHRLRLRPFQRMAHHRGVAASPSTATHSTCGKSRRSASMVISARVRRFQQADGARAVTGALPAQFATDGTAGAGHQHAGAAQPGRIAFSRASPAGGRAGPRSRLPSVRRAANALPGKHIVQSRDHAERQADFSQARPRPAPLRVELGKAMTTAAPPLPARVVPDRRCFRGSAFATCRRRRAASSREPTGGAGAGAAQVADQGLPARRAPRRSDPTGGAALSRFWWCPSSCGYSSRGMPSSALSTTRIQHQHGPAAPCPAGNTHTHTEEQRDDDREQAEQRRLHDVGPESARWRSARPRGTGRRARTPVPARTAPAASPRTSLGAGDIGWMA